MRRGATYSAEYTKYLLRAAIFLLGHQAAERGGAHLEPGGGLLAVDVARQEIAAGLLPVGRLGLPGPAEPNAMRFRARNALGLVLLYGLALDLGDVVEELESQVRDEGPRDALLGASRV